MIYSLKAIGKHPAFVSSKGDILFKKIFGADKAKLKSTQKTEEDREENK